MKVKDYFEWFDELEEKLGEAMKQKKVYNEKLSKQKKALRLPTPPKDYTFKDKSKYSRKVKHKKADY
jgi:hypothetical protein